MIKSLESILIGSSNAKKLADFYKTKVGLKQTLKAEVGDKNEGLYGFEVKGRAGIYIMDHSKVKGKNKNPSQIIINIEVLQIEKEVSRLKKAGVKPIQEIYHVENYGQIATFEDIEGNYFQLVQVRPD